MTEPVHGGTQCRGEPACGELPRVDGRLWHPRGMRSTARRLTLLDDRGDVPGWVLITLMTAALVILIWGLAGPALAGIFEDAISKVSGI